MLTVHKPLVTPYGSNVNFTIKMSNDIKCSFGFDDSGGRENTCGRNYLLITQEEDELYNEYGLSNDILKMILGFACMDNYLAIELILKGQTQ